MAADHRLRIVYFGTPSFAVPTLQHLMASEHEVCGVVTQPDKPRGRGQRVTPSPVKALALERGVAVFQPADLRASDAAQTLRELAPDLGVVAAYGQLIPDALLAIPPFGMINVHASLLPRLRGAAPIHRAVIAGLTQTGVTIMRVVARLDAGPMFARVTRPIGPDETSETVERDLAELGARLLVEVVGRIAAGTATEEPQDDALSTYAPRLTKEEGLVDWTLPARRLHDRIRGLYPWPHAYTYLDGHRLILLKSAVDSDGAGEPGVVVESSRDRLVIATGHAGRLALTELQPEGRRPMAIREFLVGRRPDVGTRLG